MARLNSNKPTVLCEGLTFDWSDVPECLYKYRPFNESLVAKLPWQARRVLDLMEEHRVEGYKSTLLDFKVRELSAGDCGCPLDGWHIDVTRNPNHKSKPDRHLIYSTVVGTEFMLTQIGTDAEDFADMHIPDCVQHWQAPADSIVLFDRFNMHRGPVVREPCKRVVIRLTQTDVF